MPEPDTTGAIQLAALPVAVPNRAFPRIRRAQKQEAPGSQAALIPLFYAALFFLAGIVLVRYIYLRPGYLLAGLAPLVAVTALCLFRALRMVWMPVALVFAILGAWSAEMEPGVAANRQVAALSDGLLRTVEGTVTNAGSLRVSEEADEVDVQGFSENDSDRRAAEQHAARETQQVDVQLSAVEVVTDESDTVVPMVDAASAGLRLSVIWPAGMASRLECGQRIRAVVRMLPPDVYHDPGVWSRAEYLEGQNLSATSSVVATKIDSGQPRLALSGTAEERSPHCLLNAIRQSAGSRLQLLPMLTRRLPAPLRASPEDGAMLTALLTGDRTYLTRSLRTGFERTGSFHLTVVSGLHLAILAGCVFALAKRLRVPRVAATVITIATTLGYALFTGFAVPAQRSFWMITLYLIGRLLYRNRSSLNVIGFATLCLAAASPRSIFDASLQMTLIAVAAIAGIGVPLLEHSLTPRIKATRDLRVTGVDPSLPPLIAQFRVLMRLAAGHLEPAFGSTLAWRVFPWMTRLILRLFELLFITLIVELALALPMAIYFHRITLYALPVNLVILPMLAILVPAAMFMLLVLSVWPPLALVPATIALSVLHFSVFIVRRLGAFAFGDFRIPDPGALQTALALLLFVAAILLACGTVNAVRWRRISLVSLMLMAVTAVYPRAVSHPANALLFEAIDVGQGDSLLLISPDGKTLLVDGGGVGIPIPETRKARGSSEASYPFDVGEEVVSTVLWSRGIRRLDAVALTHAHHDHMGGLGAILRNFHPRELWVGNNPPVAAYLELVQEAGQAGVRVRSFHAGDTIALGDADLRVLAPQAAYQPRAQPTNNDSLVLQAVYGETRILVEGDAEAPEEQSMVDEAAVLDAGIESTVLKVGHHGSVSSTRPQFLAAVGPTWAVISCGRRNRFGHPRPEILAELEASHVRTYRTDLDGAVCFELDGHTVNAQANCEH